MWCPCKETLGCVRVGGGAGVEYKFCFWEDDYFYPVWGANSTKHNN